MTPVRNHYQVLGVEPSAGRDEIRQAHRRLAHVLHPDRHADAPAAERQLAERRMREVNEAWRTLSDPERRLRYDRDRTTAAGASSASSASRASTASSASSARPAGAAGAARTGAPRESSSARAASRTSAGRVQPTVEDELDDPDDLDVHPGTFMLLRRGPMVAIVTVAVLLFVITAYAGAGGGRTGVEKVSTQMCVLLVDGSRGQLIDCSLPNDGEVKAEVKKALDCPDGTRYALVDTRFFCIPLDKS